MTIVRKNWNITGSTMANIAQLLILLCNTWTMGHPLLVSNDCEYIYIHYILVIVKLINTTIPQHTCQIGS